MADCATRLMSRLAAVTAVAALGLSGWGVADAEPAALAARLQPVVTAEMERMQCRGIGQRAHPDGRSWRAALRLADVETGRRWICRSHAESAASPDFTATVILQLSQGGRRGWTISSRPYFPRSTTNGATFAQRFN